MKKKGATPSWKKEAVARGFMKKPKPEEDMPMKKMPKKMKKMC